ncbi:hypothetical protein D1AOALGA4SA_5202 [Olavius algarvensis Delta 1 endosymbiont]|nr:hypothetical protein D1AOALGA4SA_5202 [Olavius algarvensis Delta 1 endosymbiont]
MNVGHRTPNIEHRIMYSIYFKSTERSDSAIRHYSLFISHSLKFHTSGSLWPKNGQSDRRTETTFL